MDSGLVLREITGARLICTEGFPWLCLTSFISFHSPFFHKYFSPEFLCKTQKERCQIEKKTRSFRFDFDKFSIAKESVFPLVLQHRDWLAIHLISVQVLHNNYLGAIFLSSYSLKRKGNEAKLGSFAGCQIPTAEWTIRVVQRTPDCEHWSLLPSPGAAPSSVCPEMELEEEEEGHAQGMGL